MKGDRRHFHRWLRRRQREGDENDFISFRSVIYEARWWVAFQVAVDE